MAHSNIDERRRAVKQALGRSQKLDPQTASSLAARFDCSPSAIRADMLTLTRSRKLATPHVTPRKRAIVHWRDLGICQYCLDGNPDGELIIEHIIPASSNGVAEFYNLTLACQSCNVSKSDNVWIPNNLFAIANEHAAFIDRVLKLAIDNPTSISIERDDHIDLIGAVQSRFSHAKKYWATIRPTNCAERIETTKGFAESLRQ